MDFSTKYCRVCGQNSPHISQVIGVCAGCLLTHFDEVRPHIEEVHASTRIEFSLPQAPPCHAEGKQCDLCGNNCQIEEGGLGFCGMRTVENGQWCTYPGRHSTVHCIGTVTHYQPIALQTGYVRDVSIQAATTWRSSTAAAQRTACFARTGTIGISHLIIAKASVRRNSLH